ncbi:MAG: glutamate 5-kinase [Bacteroidales bacterium]|nr:glutamate 5-kinase [Bacteroidales bacterium]
MDYRSALADKRRIVIKIGTSSLTFPNGRLNLRRIEHVTNVVAALQKQGRQIVLVSSGAIAVGVGKLGLKKRPNTIPGKQAMAAIGQAILSKIYRKFFEVHNINVGQILLTSDVITDEEKHRNAENTFAKLLEIGAVPIVNENDTVSTDEIEIGDNDTLSAMVASICKADLLIILSDIDGFFDKDPRKNPDAKKISIITDVNENVSKAAGSAGTSFGTGGMATKISAVKICHKDNIDTIIANGDSPEILFDIFEGKDIGTLFVSPNRVVK